MRTEEPIDKLIKCNRASNSGTHLQVGTRTIVIKKLKTPLTVNAAHPGGTRGYRYGICLDPQCSMVFLLAVLFVSVACGVVGAASTPHILHVIVGEFSSYTHKSSNGIVRWYLL